MLSHPDFLRLLEIQGHFFSLGRARRDGVDPAVLALGFTPIDFSHLLWYNPPVDERAFIERKQPTWDRLSETLEIAAKRGPEALDKKRLGALGPLYREIVSDLAYARTQGATDDLIAYLNSLAARAHGVMYASAGARAGGVWAFLMRDFPRAFRANYRYILAATILFFIGWGIGAYTVITNPAMRASVLPEKAKNKQAQMQTEAPDPAGMSSFIMTNNIKVGLISFAGGITAGLLTTYALISNGYSIGSIATVAAPAMGQKFFWSLILPHGVIELVAIFICGGAGLMIASAIVAPGNIRRADAIRIASGKAVRLFAGAVVMFVVAGTIEGFITPSVIPAWAKLAFAGLTAIGLAAYLGFAGGETAAGTTGSRAE